MDNILTQNSLNKMKQKLRLELGKDYKGWLSIGERLVNYYFVLHPQNEYSYFMDYKTLEIFITIWDWVSSHGNSIDNTQINIDKILSGLEEKILKPIRIELYHKWMDNKLEKELEEAQVKIANTEDKFFKSRYELYYKMLVDLIDRYPKFRTEDIPNFKRDINLC